MAAKGGARTVPTTPIVRGRIRIDLPVLGFFGFSCRD